MSVLGRMPNLMNGDALQAKGYFSLSCPPSNGRMPSICSYCFKPRTEKNPLNSHPTARDPQGMMRGHLLRTKCKECIERENARKMQGRG